MLENTEGAIKKNKQEKLATQGTQDEEKQTKTQHNMCQTPLNTRRRKTNKNTTQHNMCQTPLNTRRRKTNKNTTQYV